MYSQRLKGIIISDSYLILICQFNLKDFLIEFHRIASFSIRIGIFSLMSKVLEMGTGLNSR